MLSTVARATPGWIRPTLREPLHDIDQRLIQAPLPVDDSSADQGFLDSQLIKTWPLVPNDDQWDVVTAFGVPVEKSERLHLGVDLGAPANSKVCASAQGIVDQLGYDDDLGNFLTVINGGQIETVYGHLGSFSVHKGDLVQPGQIIGTVGTTGATKGPCLHFAILAYGTYIDPAPFLLKLKGLN